MNIETLKKEFDKNNKDSKSLLFEYDIDSLSFKGSILRNYIIENEFDLFSAEINVFDKSLDFTILNYGGNIVMHRFYKEFEIEEITILINSIVNILNLKNSD